MTLPTAADIVAFWREAGPERWFEKNEAFDAEITRRFLPVHEAAAAGKLDGWQDTPEGAFALLILLDQFPRNMFRGSPRAFATDAKALAIAEEAIAKGFDQHYQPPEQRFFYMPHMHSEELADQQRCVDLCAAAEDAEGVKFAVIHRDIIRDFGRFPHRNAVLGRRTTAQEREFLAEGGFAG
ncbi:MULTISPECIES: DUF924 family protein [unclassified Bosea (in: a-proteobacteria)]|uniref:DUF924 family protein n=1 Tax=unclassified Bosea (in: a-proteobacteria) TaxID=2653178 RepID=UPI000953CF1E|nr:MULTISPECIES: DUF924 family protein [unclassified Bosea (in: a-proteobacteria)]TAJ30417.1 MAG: DUF924 domain-containing protein [Bosea sp. (in: a-proteobacteria)]SIQ25560.1 Uncharacterized conserved protein, DUF924 family [Bosea sp. TND4EK4]